MNNECEFAPIFETESPSALKPVKIPLQKQDGTVLGYAVVDQEDFAALSLHRWYLSNNGYAMRNLYIKTCSGRTVHFLDLMHRCVLNLRHGDPRECDHINRDKLDNRRCNLRVVTRAENMQNRPNGHVANLGFHNVRSDVQPTYIRYYAHVVLHGKQYVGKSFRTVQEAAEQAIQMRKELHPCAGL